MAIIRANGGTMPESPEVRVLPTIPQIGSSQNTSELVP